MDKLRRTSIKYTHTEYTSREHAANTRIESSYSGDAVYSTKIQQMCARRMFTIYCMRLIPLTLSVSDASPFHLMFLFGSVTNTPEIVKKSRKKKINKGITERSEKRRKQKCEKSVISINYI